MVLLVAAELIADPRRPTNVAKTLHKDMYTPIKDTTAQKIFSKSAAPTADGGSATFFSPLRSNVGPKDESRARVEHGTSGSLARNLSIELALVVAPGERGATSGSGAGDGGGSVGALSNSNSRANSGRHAQVRKGNKQVTAAAAAPSPKTELATAHIARWWLQAARYSLASYHGWYEVSWRAESKVEEGRERESKTHTPINRQYYGEYFYEEYENATWQWQDEGKRAGSSDDDNEVGWKEGGGGDGGGSSVSDYDQGPQWNEENNAYTKFEWNEESTEHLDAHFPFASWNGETPYYDYRVDYDVLAEEWDREEQERWEQEQAEQEGATAAAEAVVAVGAGGEEQDGGYHSYDYSQAEDQDYWSQQGWEDWSEYYGDDAHYEWYQQGYDEYSYYEGGEQEQQQQQSAQGTGTVMALALSGYTAKGETELSLSEGETWAAGVGGDR